MDPLGLTAIARTRALMGQPDEARRMLAELAQIAGTIYVPAALLADVHLALGENDRAIECLEEALEERALVSAWLPYERRYDPLRGYPRFAELLTRIGFGEKTPA